MKKISILFILLSGINLSFGQDTLKKHIAKPHMITINCGVSMPLSGFADNAVLATDGFAKPGLNVDIEAAYFFIKYIGLGVKIGYNTFSIDNDRLNASHYEFNDIGKLNFTFNDGYLCTTVMGGIYSNLLTYKKLTISAKVLAGLLSINKPKYSVHYDKYNVRTPDASKSVDEDVSANTNFKITGLAGLSLKYQVEPKTSLNLNVEYTQASGNFDFTLNDLLRNSQTKIKLINITFGWSFYL